jgi:calcineurin-like phosphoesterase family protein
MEMIETLIVNHNSLVAPDDLVIVNGDVCYQKTPEFLPYVEKFNGKKILIRGNHDRVFSDEQLHPYFEDIYEEGQGMAVSVESMGLDLYITHYPTQARTDAFNLVGHIHGAWKYQLNSLNVGVDVHHFKPLDILDVPFFVEAINKFYDDDVWSAYHQSNEQFRDVRGVRGSYLDKK